MREENSNKNAFESMLADLNVAEPRRFCQSGNRIDRICTNYSCSNTLLCSQLECPVCGVGIHPTCLTLPLPGITALLNHRINSYKTLVTKVIAVDDQFATAILNSKMQHLKKSYLSRDPKYQTIVDILYRDANGGQIGGRDAKQFCEKVQEKRIISNHRLAQLVETYRSQLNQIFSSVVKVKQWLYQQFLDQFQIDSSILRKEDPASREHLEYLRQALANPKQLHLLYRASDHNFSATTFHSKCDTIPNTLTLLRNEFGKTLAGFTKYPWNAANNDWVHDFGRQSFLLSVDLREKMTPMSRYKLIYCSNSCGPTFGGGPDLKIADQCDRNLDSFAQFPTTYNNNDKYVKGQEAWRQILGTEKGPCFRVKEYEVFQVVWNEDIRLIEIEEVVNEKGKGEQKQTKIYIEESKPIQQIKKKDDSFCSLQ